MVISGVGYHNGAGWRLAVEEQKTSMPQVRGLFNLQICRYGRMEFGHNLLRFDTPEQTPRSAKPHRSRPPKHAGRIEASSRPLRGLMISGDVDYANGYTPQPAAACRIETAPYSLQHE
ncbi:MAG TPA: hypothetical protein EYG03_28090 [Planctomycetes bacterium]|nr:hypothetical protein [Planctomycetota bacterium]